MSLQKRLTWLVVFLTGVGVVLAILFAANPGRAWVAVVAAGAVAYFVGQRVAHARYCAVLRTAADSLGLDYLATREDEESSGLLANMRRTSESDVFRWKVDGKLPALAGTFQGFPVVVRVPVGVDFDAWAPDSTRIGVYHDVRMTGFTVCDRSRLKKTPKGRQAVLGDEAFDSRFLVLAHRREEAETVLTPEVRALLLEAGGVGFRGVEVNRYGVFLHEEGKVSSPELLEERLRLAVKVAEAARELAPAKRR
ncbi:MAG TPA: hypothetical protein DGR79_05925 [Clostridiales bacterium]|nr:hypothetical protein [Clostridiales bacterium]